MSTLQKNKLYPTEENSETKPACFEIVDAIKLLMQKLDEYKIRQNYLAKIGALIRESNHSGFQQLDFSDHEIDEYINNAAHHALLVDQRFNNGQAEISATATLLHELKKLMELKNQLSHVENYYLGIVFHENKNFFSFEEKKNLM